MGLRSLLNRQPVAERAAEPLARLAELGRAEEPDEQAADRPSSAPPTAGGYPSRPVAPFDREGAAAKPVRTLQLLAAYRNTRARFLGVGMGRSRGLPTSGRVVRCRPNRRATRLTPSVARLQPPARASPQTAPGRDATVGLRLRSKLLRASSPGAPRRLWRVASRSACPSERE